MHLLTSSCPHHLYDPTVNALLRSSRLFISELAIFHVNLPYKFAGKHSAHAVSVHRVSVMCLAYSMHTSNGP